MNKKIIIGIALLLVCCTAGRRFDIAWHLQLAASGAFSPLDLDPVSWWRGEDNALDTASTNNGAWAGTETYADGICGRAFSFVGSSVVKIGNPEELQDITTCTLVAWSNSDTFSNYQAIFGAGPLSNGAEAIGMYANSTSWYVQTRVLAEIQVTSYAHSSDTGNWHHLVMVKTALKQEIWVDGVLRDTEVPAAAETPNRPWGIGATFPRGWRFYFDGLIDEVMYFNKALTEPEIKQIYNWRE